MHGRQMSISLNSIQEQFVLSQLKNGKYTSADEVISAAFKLLEEEEKQYAIWLEDTRKKVEVGLEDIERGDVIDTEVVINRLKDKLNQKRASQT